MCCDFVEKNIAKSLFYIAKKQYICKSKIFAKLNKLKIWKTQTNCWIFSTK